MSGALVLIFYGVIFEQRSANGLSSTAEEANILLPQAAGAHRPCTSLTSGLFVSRHAHDFEKSSTSLRSMATELDPNKNHVISRLGRSVRKRPITAKSSMAWSTGRMRQLLTRNQHAPRLRRQASAYDMTWRRPRHESCRAPQAVPCIRDYRRRGLWLLGGRMRLPTPSTSHAGATDRELTRRDGLHRSR